MNVRISKSLAAAALALTLLAGCGGPTDAAPPASTAPSSSAAAPGDATTGPSPTPTPTRDAAADTKAVQEAASTFVETALTLDYSDGAEAAYEKRVRPLMTAEGYAQVADVVPSGKNLTALRSRFGQDARSHPQILGTATVTSLEAGRASATQKFKPRVQKREDGRWRTVKAAVVDEEAQLTLVEQDGRWLVDRLA